MAGIDVVHLEPIQLVRLLNSTPAGTVVTAAAIRRQMNRGGFRIGDGKTVNLVRYVQWLVDEVESQKGIGDHRDADLKRKRMSVRAAQNIAPIPEIQNADRRNRCKKYLRKFCKEYFPEVFVWEWSEDHLRVIKILQRVIRTGDMLAFAMPRASGKTCLARAAAFWAVLYGYRPFVTLIGGSEKKAKELIEPMKMAILENPRLLADFPEAIYPLRCLENTAKRQAQQHCNGQLTHVKWEPDRLVFASLPEDVVGRVLAPIGEDVNPTGGSIISVTSLDAHMRGQQHTRADGSVIRPSLVLLDDPQTRASARSPGQTKLRMDLIYGDVLGMAGPGVRISAMMTCTKIYEEDLADQILDQEEHPEWQGQCTKLIHKFPTNTKLWAKYAEIRADGLRRGKGLGPATAFYKKNRKAMDKGAKVAWPERYDRDSEISALQHGMNLKLRNEVTFFSEYQNEPMQEQISDDVLTPAAVAEKLNGRKRGVVPLSCPYLTGFIDVHDRVLYRMVCAWQNDFTGYLIDYDTFPDQGVPWFELRTAKRTLKRKYPKRGIDAVIQAGLEDAIEEMLNREWPRSGGQGVLRVGRLLVDMGYKSELVAAAKHKVGGDTMLLSRGVGIGARNRPMTEYRRKPGERYGHHWYQPSVKGTREFPHIAVDVNYWKTWLHEAIATPAGDPGNFTLFGRKPKDHELLAEHIAGSESWIETSGYGRTLHEWKIRPTRPDNHWLDDLVGCAVGASMLGAKASGMKIPGHSGRKKYTQADLGRQA